MEWTDPKNPLSYVLPAGVLAYVASPEVRKAVRTAAVKGVASVLELAEKAEGASTGFRDGFQGIVDEARKMREEAKQPAIRVDVENAESASGGPEPAAA